MPMFHTLLPAPFTVPVPTESLIVRVPAVTWNTPSPTVSSETVKSKPFKSTVRSDSTTKAVSRSMLAPSFTLVAPDATNVSSSLLLFTAFGSGVSVVSAKAILNELTATSEITRSSDKSFFMVINHPFFFFPKEYI